MDDAIRIINTKHEGTAHRMFSKCEAIELFENILAQAEDLESFEGHSEQELVIAQGLRWSMYTQLCRYYRECQVLRQDIKACIIAKVNKQAIVNVINPFIAKHRLTILGDSETADDEDVTTSGIGRVPILVWAGEADQVQNKLEELTDRLVNSDGPPQDVDDFEDY